MSSKNNNNNNHSPNTQNTTQKQTPFPRVNIYTKPPAAALEKPVATVPEPVLRRFYSKSLLFFNLAGIAGFFLGCKVCDFLFFKPEKYQLMRETMQEQYWAVNGEPKMIEPTIVACVNNPTKLRKSWIQILYGKDQYVKKREE